MSLAVVCPTRGRKQMALEMARSVRQTSEATVLLYADSDDLDRPTFDRDEYPYVRYMVSGSVGRGTAINALVNQFPDFRAYLLVSDDVLFIRPGWDLEVLKAMDSFGDDIGLVHLQSENGEPHVNWPCVSKTWIDTLGWFNPPQLKHFCQDTVLSCLATAVDRVKYITPQVLHHARILNEKAPAHEDFAQFLDYMARHFDADSRKLRKAMACQLSS